MHTDKRLTEAYKNARIEYFDENSKYVFFSDFHRSNGSHSDEFTKNRNICIFALEYYYKNGFTYVEAGDGDELWEHPRFRDIKNAHSDVFDVLKRFFNEERLIMLYGNHNIYLKKQKYVEDNYYIYYNNYKEVNYDFMKGLKPCEGLVLKNRNTKQEILVVHGHQGDFSNDQFWFPTMLSLKYFWRYLHALGAKSPSSPVANMCKRHRIEKNYVKWVKKHKKMIICGHTHRYKYPKNNEMPYFNIGCCIYPTSITNIEITCGEIQLVQWHILPNKDGVLQIRRKVLMGPNPIQNYDISKTKLNLINRKSDRENIRI